MSDEITNYVEGLVPLTGAERRARILALHEQGLLPAARILHQVVAQNAIEPTADSVPPWEQMQRCERCGTPVSTMDQPFCTDGGVIEDLTTPDSLHSYRRFYHVESQEWVDGRWVKRAAEEAIPCR